MNPDLHDQAHPYAVGALSPEESAEFAAHLETCSTCRHEVAALSDVTAALSDSVATDPPPQLRDAVLAEISRTPQVPATAEHPLHSSAPPAPSTPAAGSLQPVPALRDHDGPAEDGVGTTDVVPIRPSRAATWTTSLVAAAAVLAAIAFGGLWWQERQDDATTQADQLATVLTADDVQLVRGMSTSSRHTGAIVMSRDAGKAFFIGSDLPSLPDDKVYEAWTITGADAPAPAGTFPSSSSPTAVELPAASFEADQMAITVEPAGGSDRPTSDAVTTFTMPSA